MHPADDRVVCLRKAARPDQGWLYAGSYSDDDLRWWAERIREWDRGGRDVYAYFNNDGNGFAVNNARQLKALLQEP